MYKIILILFFSIKAFSQEEKKIVIADIENKQPIPFISINFKDKNVFSNKNGVIQLNHVNLSDTLYFDSPNFESKQVLFSEVRDTIFLVPTTTLDELIISKNIIKIDNFNTKKTSSFPLSVGSELVNVVDFSEELKGKFLSKISFIVFASLKFEGNQKLLKDKKLYLRLNIYNSSNDKIYESNPFKLIKFKNELINVEIDKEIQIGNDPLKFGVEVIGFVNENGEFVEVSDTYLRVRFYDLKSNYVSAVKYFTKTRNSLTSIDTILMSLQIYNPQNLSFEVQD